MSVSDVLARAAAAATRDVELKLAAAADAERYREDPVSFCRDVLKFEPWSKQREILESVRDHPRTAVRSGHGTGKSAVAARTCLWFLSSYPQSRVITTAPTWALVRDVLWPEIHKAHHAAGDFIGGQLSATRLDLGADRFAIGLSTDRPERFQGHHAEHLLLVVDEASGVEEGIFEAADGYMTGPHARLLLIGNPTQLSGEFYAAFHTHRDLYNTIAISVLDTPYFTGEELSPDAARHLPTQSYVDEMGRKYGGADSPVYQVRVLGEFPRVSDDNVVALGQLEASYRRTTAKTSPAVIAVDVARFGSDETVIAVRHGNHVRIHKVLAGKDTMEVTGAVFQTARDVKRMGVDWPVIVIDDPGVGGGVTDRLKELFREKRLGGSRVVAHNGGGRAYDARDYPNRRSELWFTFADRLPELDLESDDQLTADLVAPKYSIDSRGRRVLEPKEQTKRRLNRSPDRGDAIVMTFADRLRSGTVNLDVDEHEPDPLARRRRARNESAPLPYGSSL